MQLDSNKNENSKVFHSLVNDLKRPLVLLAREAELAEITKQKSSFKSIKNTAEHTLKLIDSYLLLAKSEYGQLVLPLESVGVGAVIYDVMQDIEYLAKRANVEVNCQINGGNVMANRSGLKATIFCLSDMALSAAQEGKRGKLLISTKQVDKNIRISILSDSMEVKNSDIKRASKHQGKAHRAFNNVSSDSGVRLALAEALSSALGSHLTAAKSKNLQGIGFDLLKSQQLSLV